MQSLLHHGVPTEFDYKSLLKTQEFKEVENFSDHFLLANRTNLGSYAKRWVNDPLHQWSRQWEYPYVFSQIKTILNAEDKAQILDAGSGVTFFPYCIKSKYPSTRIFCADYDKDLENVYQRINASSNENVHFSTCDLKHLSYEDNSFDVIYCISVLEHTDDYQKILEGFHRILRPGGSLIITFDVSLDGTRDISIENGNVLLRLLAEMFSAPENISLDLRSNLDDIFTTVTAKKINPNLLPWKLPALVYQAKSWITDKKLIPWPPLLTLFCLTFVKRSS